MYNNDNFMVELIYYVNNNGRIEMVRILFDDLSKMVVFYSLKGIYSSMKLST